MFTSWTQLPSTCYINLSKIYIWMCYSSWPGSFVVHINLIRLRSDKESNKSIMKACVLHCDIPPSQYVPLPLEALDISFKSNQLRQFWIMDQNIYEATMGVAE